MREGSLEPPKRAPLNWTSPDFYDPAKLDAELRRVFDICHGCRLCFNLCGSFPKLFDLVDAAGDRELAGVESAAFKSVADACTLCDLCFMAKCPYVPPHRFNIDFPHLMLRYRAVERKNGIRPSFAARQLAATDRNGRLCSHVAGTVNRLTRVENVTARAALEKTLGVDRRAELPLYRSQTLVRQAARAKPPINREAPAHGRKAAIFATCHGNYNDPAPGLALLRVLAHNGVATETVYPGCCAMPQLEQGDLEAAAQAARSVASAFKPWIEQNYAVIAPTPSCALMLKSEWPLLLPDDPDVAALAKATRDAAQYVVEIARAEGLAPGLKSLDGGVTLHLACHARAQNVGQKAAEMLRLIPGIDLKTIERCSGHGGTWGVLKENFDAALKLGRPVARQAVAADKAHIASECPLAGTHILQCMEQVQSDAPDAKRPARAPHPIELFAQAYGLSD